MTKTFRVIMTIVLVLLIAGCGRMTSIKIGFVGTLVGQNSDISITARNGAILAIEEIKHSQQLPLFTTGWGATGNIFIYGGPAVEGLIFPEIEDRNLAGTDFSKFQTAYFKRFGEEPTLASARSYEVVQIIAQAITLSKNTEPAAIKKAILRIGTFKGLSGEFSIDQYGDAERPTELFVIKNRQFVKVPKND